MTMNKKQALVVLAVKVGFGASMALGFSTMAHAEPSGETVHMSVPVVQVQEIDVESDGSVFVTSTPGGPALHEKLDNGSWRAVTEDDQEWSCADDGNRICGPSNEEGQPAGCYDDGGVLVASWPCKPVS